jgi:hypothetical protein
VKNVDWTQVLECLLNAIDEKSAGAQLQELVVAMNDINAAIHVVATNELHSKGNTWTWEDSKKTLVWHEDDTL